MSVTEQNNVPSDSDLIYSYRYGKWGDVGLGLFLTVMELLLNNANGGDLTQ